MMNENNKGWDFRMTVLWFLAAILILSLSFLTISYGWYANWERSRKIEAVVKEAKDAIAQAQASNAQIGGLLRELQFVKDTDEMNAILRKYIGAPAMQTTNKTKGGNK